MYERIDEISIKHLLITLLMGVILLLLTNFNVFSALYSNVFLITKNFQESSFAFFYNAKIDAEFLVNISDIKEKNKELEKENLNLRNQLLKSNQEYADCKLIEKQSTFNVDFKTIPVNIIKYHNTGYVNLNKGQKYNIKVNDIGVIENYFIGFVVESYEDYSILKLYSTPNMKTPVQVLETGDKGLLSVQADGTMKVNGLLNNHEIKEGQKIITAGTDGIVPRGLLIGEIEEVESSISDITKTVVVKNDLKLNNLYSIFILSK